MTRTRTLLLYACALLLTSTTAQAKGKSYKYNEELMTDFTTHLKTCSPFFYDGGQLHPYAMLKHYPKGATLDMVISMGRNTTHILEIVGQKNGKCVVKRNNAVTGKFYCEHSQNYADIAYRLHNKRSSMKDVNQESALRKKECKPLK